MTISDKIGSNHVEEMNKIVSFIDSFNVHKLLYALTTKQMDEDTIEDITLDIREQNNRLERQKVYLFRFSKSFNKEWATDDNKFFDTSARLSFKMRSGIKGIKKSVKAFCKRSRKTLLPGQEAPQAIDCSLISSETVYMQDLFGLESYPPCVTNLFQEMISFHENMLTCLEESLRTLREEKDTRANPHLCLELLREAVDKSKKNLAVIFQAMEKDPHLKEAMVNSEFFKPTNDSPVLKAWANSEGNEEKKRAFASAFFHNCLPVEVNKIGISKTLTEAEGDTELGECMAIFDCDATQARHINEGIDRFDSLLPEQCKGNKIPAMHLHVFMRWCSRGVGQATFLGYFFKRYRAAGGKWQDVGKSALSGASSKCAKGDKQYLAIRKNMLDKLEKMFSA